MIDFLDNVTKRTLEIMGGKIADYPYPYSIYKIKREEEIERLTNAKKQQDKEIKETKELIDKFRAKANKAAFAQSLMKNWIVQKSLKLKAMPLQK